MIIIIFVKMIIVIIWFVNSFVAAIMGAVEHLF